MFTIARLLFGIGKQPVPRPPASPNFTAPNKISKRRKSLTSTDTSSTVWKKARFNDQEQCLLFKLPAELRLKIYQDVIGSWSILLFYDPNPPRFRSARQRIRVLEYHPEEVALPSKWEPDMESKLRSKSLLPLLLVCRRL